MSLLSEDVFSSSSIYPYSRMFSRDLNRLAAVTLVSKMECRIVHPIMSEISAILGVSTQSKELFVKFSRLVKLLLCYSIHGYCGSGAICIGVRVEALSLGSFSLIDGSFRPFAHNVANIGVSLGLVLAPLPRNPLYLSQPYFPESLQCKYHFVALVFSFEKKINRTLLSPIPRSPICSSKWNSAKLSL